MGVQIHMGLKRITMDDKSEKKHVGFLDPPSDFGWVRFNEPYEQFPGGKKYRMTG